MLTLLLFCRPLWEGWGPSEEQEEEQMVSERRSASSGSWVPVARLEERCCWGAAAVQMK